MEYFLSPPHVYVKPQILLKRYYVQIFSLEFFYMLLIFNILRKFIKSLFEKVIRIHFLFAVLSQTFKQLLSNL